MSRYLVRQSDVTPYSPANHTGTKNFRLIGPETVGGEKFELKAGEACFFPPEAVHLLIVKREKAKVLVIYAPPYLEKE